MKLIEAYYKALDEESDPKERAEVSSDVEIKACIVEEVVEAMKEIRNIKDPNRTPAQLLKPMFGCVAFWFIIGIRVGKILRDEELAAK